MKYLFPLILALAGCQMDELIDSVMTNELSGHEIYYMEEWENLNSYREISNWVMTHIEYREKTNNNSEVKKILEDGYCDCDGIALVFMNIAYVSLGDEFQYCVVNSESRSIELGGTDFNHVMVRIDGVVWNPQVGISVPTQEVQYYYDFWEVFE